MFLTLFYSKFTLIFILALFNFLGLLIWFSMYFVLLSKTLDLRWLPILLVCPARSTRDLTNSYDSKIYQRSDLIPGFQGLQIVNLGINLGFLFGLNGFVHLLHSLNGLSHILQCLLQCFCNSSRLSFLNLACLAHLSDLDSMHWVRIHGITLDRCGWRCLKGDLLVTDFNFLAPAGVATLDEDHAFVDAHLAGR